MDNHIYSTIESLIDSSGDVNTAIVRREQFKDLDIYKKFLKIPNVLTFLKK